MGTMWELLVSGEELKEVSKSRALNKIEEKFDKDLINTKLNSGWSIEKEYKNGSCLMSKPKKIGDSFEDEVWTLFNKMGFTIMNKDNNFAMSYSDDHPNLTKQIDVLAIDDETCLFIECKETATLNNSKSWLNEIGELSFKMNGLRNEVRKQYPNRKIKFIFATKNYVLGKQDLDRLEEANIAYFDDETIEYYKALVSHLGTASRYQLLGNLFKGTDIKGMEERVPAIEGKMGGLTYYSFSIEPERLLKISYVLHRNNANRDMMPTYQRLIKKDRLNKIREFVNNGGYFPNSLIISIDDPQHKLRFDRAKQDIPDAISKIGILHLPKKYQTAYIIDGQHRLYGYSESNYANTNSIPVVAFVNLDKDEQVKMFMDINENQKAVSKSLRNTLIINMNFTSDNLKKRREAIILDVSEKLGESKTSPLYGRVITGENTTTETRCITVEYLKWAFERTGFFNDYKKNNEIVFNGKFDQIDGEKTEKILCPFVEKCLKTISEYCEDQWTKGSNGYLTINNTMVAVIRILGDIVDIVAKQNGLTYPIYDWLDLYNKCEYYIMGLCDVINNLTPEKRIEIKTYKGGSAKEESWRKLQVELRQYLPEFTNPDLENYIQEHCTDYNGEASVSIDLIRDKYISVLKKKFEENPNWRMDYLPTELEIALNQKVVSVEIVNQRQGIDKKVNIWDVIGFEEIVKIIGFKTNWSSIIKELFTKKDNEMNKQDTVSNLLSINSSDKKIKSGKRISKSDYDLIKGVEEYIEFIDKDEEK